METYLPYWITRIYAQYGAVFRIPDTFQASPVFDQNGAKAYLPRFWPTKRQNSYSASISVSQILTKKIQLSIFYGCLQEEGLLGIISKSLCW
jgi:hypothetical protein